MVMGAKVINRSTKSFKLEIEIPYTANMLDAEELIQKSLNDAGTLATQEAMSSHDTDGSPIIVGNCKFTSKGQEEKRFQTPYGEIKVKRHVYQSSQGGKVYIPLDINCRVINTSTPKFAKMISSKYACDAAPGVQRDLLENHNRKVALSFIKNTTDAIGVIAEAKEESWSYELPKFHKPVKSISLGLDGTCLNMMEDGWREAMCGTIAFFDRNGDRLHTIYTSASPEYGKSKFYKKFQQEAVKIKNKYSKTPIVGLADGAKCNWEFLKPLSNHLTIDFWHVAEYLSKAAYAMYPKDSQSDERDNWLEDSCHKLKHKVGSATRILNELLQYKQQNKLNKDNLTKLQTTITYLINNKDKMHYHKNVAANMPIGSGITESACKTIVKQRMCKGAARWKNEGATTVLTLRSLHATNNRWEQFWKKYSQYGYQHAA